MGRQFLWIVLGCLFLLGWLRPLQGEMAPPTLERFEIRGEPSTELRLSWETIPGHIYELQESEDLKTWTTAQGYPVEARVNRLVYSFSSSQERGFFRVVDRGPPVSPREVEVFFSVAGEKGTEYDLTLENKLEELLEQAVRGSQVLASVFTWSRGNMSDAFLRAYDRGVDVRLIIGSDYSAVEKLVKSMRTGRVLVCRNSEGVPNGCHGGRINHNKFFLFSELADGSKDVVVQSSANLTNPQLRNHNNMVIIRNDTALFNAYHIYWNDLYREVDDPNYYWQTGEESPVQAYFFPRAEGNGRTGEKDTVVEILDGVIAAPGSEIRIAMAFWTNARVGIAHRLVELKNAGVSVQVVVHPDEIGNDVFAALEAGGIPVTQLRTVHSKYLLLHQGRGRTEEWLVFTGSHNYTSPALRSNDEVLLRLRGADTYQTFLQDWIGMRHHPLAE